MHVLHMAPGLIFAGKPLDVAEIKGECRILKQMLCIYLLLFSDSKLNSRVFFVSQSAMDDFITRTQSCGLLYLALPVKHPLVVSHAEP